MALFGQARDISMFRYVNRELMGNIISQQAAFYKLRLSQTNFNMYGEAAEQKYYDGPILLYTLIDLPEQEWSTDDLGVNWNWKPTFKFLRDDLLDKLKDFNEDTIYGANLVPQPGDIILYETAYYEVTSTNAAQYFVGKDPDYPNSPQPLPQLGDPIGAYPLPSPLWNPGLDEFGYNVSIICQTAYIPADKVGITFERM
jgi:hypothetical protein